MRSMVIPRFLFAVVGVLFGFATNALAGPPLICHAIEIGQAKSLPPINWNSSGTGGYVLKNLSRDTLAILDSNSSVLVRMETLRRATIYAHHDPEAAKELLLKLRARADHSEASGHPDALSWFDVGYLAEAYRQWMERTTQIQQRGSTATPGFDEQSGYVAKTRRWNLRRLWLRLTVPRARIGNT